MLELLDIAQRIGAFDERSARSEHSANAWLAGKAAKGCNPSHCCNSKAGWHTHACLLANSPPCDPYNSIGSKV